MGHFYIKIIQQHKETWGEEEEHWTKGFYTRFPISSWNGFKFSVITLLHFERKT
jgi:hypothetical protein